MVETGTVTIPDIPDGLYAIVECFGHQTLIGRVEEVERFGTKMLQIEAILRGELLPPRLVGGGAIYAMTMVDPAVAFTRAPTSDWQIPETLRHAIPASMLPPPDFTDGGEFVPDFLRDDDQ